MELSTENAHKVGSCYNFGCTPHSSRALILCLHCDACLFGSRTPCDKNIGDTALMPELIPTQS
jgi:hypothetical protein